MDGVRWYNVPLLLVVGLIYGLCRLVYAALNALLRPWR